MLPIESVHPLKAVWLKPRRVFRELSSRPAGVTDYLLASAQGVGNFLALYRTEGAGARFSVTDILANSFAYGAVAGVITLLLMGVIYARLGARAGGKATIPQVIHVLAYGGMPLVASFVLWVLTALLVGEAAFIEISHARVEIFVALLLHVQFISYVLLLIWSIVLQVMGLSEILGLAMRKAFGIWVLGQLIGFLASLFLALIVETLFPGLLIHVLPQR